MNELEDHLVFKKVSYFDCELSLKVLDFFFVNLYSQNASIIDTVLSNEM